MVCLHFLWYLLKNRLLMLTFSIFQFYAWRSCALLKRSFSTPNPKGVLLYFLQKSWLFTLKFLIYLELIFIYLWGRNLSYFHMLTIAQPLYWIILSFPITLQWYFGYIPRFHICMSLFWAPYFPHWSNLFLCQHYPVFIFIVCNKSLYLIKEVVSPTPNLFFTFRRILDILELVHFYMNSGSTCQVPQKSCWDFNWNFIG